MTGETYLGTIDVSRVYKRARHEVRALDGVTMSLTQGDFTSIVGSSGSGKTTLLNLLAGLDTPTSGSVMFRGIPLSSMSRRQLASYRARHVGMIFQSFNLISHFSALQNVETALLFHGTPRAERRKLATDVLQELGLGERLDHRPADLSGGEQQRVAIARAIVKKPDILFADEPTGNLDLPNAIHIATLLHDLHRSGLTIVLVTHNPELALKYSTNVIRMQYGTISDDQRS